MKNFSQKAAALISTTVLAASVEAAQVPAVVDGVELPETWDKVFPESNLVVHHKVAFKNRYGFTLAGDLYLPKTRKSGEKLAAVVLAGPFGAVKEQSSGLYAQELAERGFAALAFDPSFTGESSGTPRNVASPDINTEDFSAAVDYLGIQPEIDRNRIGLVGICGFGGIGLNAAAADTRIRAAVSVVMYDMSRAMGWGVGDGKDRYTTADRQAIKKFLNERRWEDARSGSFAHAAHDIGVDSKGNVSQGDRILPETLPENPHPVLKEFFDYYRVKRGFHPRSVNSTSAWTATMPLSFMNFPQLTYISEISPRPTLIITGEAAHSRYFAETAYRNAAQPKRLIVVPGANHVDLYDRKDKIPFDEIEKFLKTNLK
ncbi:MAG TPA: hypothetical protein DCZ56_00440 [Sutterella sp.]|nr:hypothetical protein [Sutterella sp.]